MDAITLWQLITHPRVKKADYITLRIDVCVCINIDRAGVRYRERISLYVAV